MFYWHSSLSLRVVTVWPLIAEPTSRAQRATVGSLSAVSSIRAARQGRVGLRHHWSTAERRAALQGRIGSLASELWALLFKGWLRDSIESAAGFSQQSGVEVCGLVSHGRPSLTGQHVICHRPRQTSFPVQPPPRWRSLSSVLRSDEGCDIVATVVRREPRVF